MSTVTELRPRAVARTLPRGMWEPLQGGEDVFWRAALGTGVDLLAELAEHLDLISGSIARLPRHAGPTRPAATAYMSAVTTLAEAWQTRLRRDIQEAAQALAAVGTGAGGPASRAASTRARALVPGGIAPAMVKRMANVVALLDGLAAAYDHELDQMAAASRALDHDTGALTERLQADQVHALLLSQQASTLQSKLDDATMRQHAYWLLGPHAEQIRQEIAMHSSAREGVRRQLDHLRGEQVATLAEARYLDRLMPSLAIWLGALDRTGSALHAVLEASQVLLQGWRAVQSGRSTLTSAALREQHQAAAPHWQALQASVRRLRRPAQGSAITTPDGYRT